MKITIKKLLLTVGLSLLVCIAHAAPKDKTIYLTFDDGPINVTKNLVDVLNDNQVKGTFFINGSHMFGSGGENEDKAVDSIMYLLKSGHIIANHSYDHMIGYHTCQKDKVADENFYNTYCSTLSVRTYFDPTVDYVFFEPLNVTKIRSVIYSDRYKLPHDAGKLYPNDHLSDMARMPFVNNWRVQTKEGSITGNAPCATTDDKPPATYTADDFKRCLQHPSKSAKNAFQLADLLAKNGYQVFGWDVAWSHWGTAEAVASAESFEPYVEAAFNGCHPRTVENFMTDRVPDLNCDSPLHKNKVIILHHDFLLEKGRHGAGDKNLVELDKFIKSMKSKGYRFDTLDNYLIN